VDGVARYAGVEDALALSGVSVHIYGKPLVKPGRKMGHVTLTGDMKTVQKNLKKISVQTKSKVKFAVAASGNGTVFQSIIDAVRDGSIPNGEIACVFTDNPEAGVLKRAKDADVPSFYIDHKLLPEQRDDAILDVLQKTGAEFLFLAGYLKKISPRLIANLSIYNTHPAHDLERFGGKGMYGIRVHEAVIAAGAKTTGATIHRVDENYDTGAIVMQTPPVKVLPSDTGETLQQKVLAEEYKLVPKFIAKMVEQHQ